MTPASVAHAFWASMNGTQAGDPAKLARALVELADSPEPPLRWAAGDDVVESVEDKARLLAGMQLGASPESLTWSNGAWVSGDGGDPSQIETIADSALYAHGTGELPPGVEGGLDAQAVYRD